MFGIFVIVLKVEAGGNAGIFGQGLPENRPLCNFALSTVLILCIITINQHTSFHCYKIHNCIMASEEVAYEVTKRK
jgi:hypothetical protein